MINLFRQNQRILMLAIAIVTIVSFIWLYNSAEISDLSKSSVAAIYDHSLTRDQIAREAKNYQLAMALGQTDLLMSLRSGGQDQDSAALDFVWNLLVVEHEAGQLGIHPTDAQIEERFKSLPVFQTNGAFDSRKYLDFVQTQLTPRGFSKDQLDNIMRNSLRLEKIKQIVQSTVSVGDAEILHSARMLQKVDASFVRFDLAASAAAVKISPEEISGYYNRNKLNLQAPETRVVRCAIFELPVTATPLDGKQRVDALQKLADKATDFSGLVLTSAGKDFAASAAAAGANVKTTPTFDRAGKVSSTPAEGELDDEEAIAGLAAHAFLLDEAKPTSDVFQVADEFFVLELSKVNKSHLLSLEEATPQIETTLRAQKAEHSLKESGIAAVKSLREAMSTGSSFADAAAKAGLKVETIISQAPLSQSITPDVQRAAVATLPMQDGQLSGFEQAPWGGFCVWLKSRAPLDEKEFAAKEKEFRATTLKNKEAIMFVEWLRAAREKANPHFLERS